MKHDFLVRPHLNQAFEPEGSAGGAWGSGITRRSFIKRTGGATVASLVAWNLATTKSRAEEEPEGGYGDSYQASLYRPPCPGKCNQWKPDNPAVVYYDDSTELNDPNRYFIKGTCYCDHSSYPAWKKEMAPGLGEPEPTWAGSKTGLVHHDVDHHKIH